MNNYGELINENTLKFQRVLPGKIERVWQYIVDPELRGKWFAAGAIDLKPEGVMQLNFNHASLAQSDDPIPEKFKSMENGSQSSARILKVDAPTLFVMEWEGGVVTFKLTQKSDDEVFLTLTHERLQDSIDYRMGVLAGWHTHLDILVYVVSDNDTQGFWKVYMPLEAHYAEELKR